MELDLSLPRMKPRGLHTDEDTISLLRRLAAHYPDDVIAGILNRQGRKQQAVNASRRIRFAACVAIATFRATNRQQSHPPGRSCRFARQHRSWGFTLPRFIGG